ncbi:type II toxin-antitoxin system MqsR family toxin [Herbaspirillum seropedicae]|uniref:type II toxin-antitoxin system MqsR family toxin n=1 Tax=Herbaspirillum seropedicae TaxID=964 RepID=UPI0031D2C8A0
MEKHTAHCKLPVVRKLIEAGKVKATATAFQGARACGIGDLDGICAVILGLRPRDFHKSMTTHADHRVWQDVYHTRLHNGMVAYLKLSVVDDVLVVSFKEL